MSPAALRLAVAPRTDTAFCGLLTASSLSSRAANASWLSLTSAESILFTASSTAAIAGSFAANSTSGLAAFHSAHASPAKQKAARQASASTVFIGGLPSIGRHSIQAQTALADLLLLRP